MEEVGEYIHSRLRTAGSEEAIFTPDAVRQIGSASCGAPGLINVICEHALLDGYRRQARAIGPEIIDACLGGLGLGDDGRWLAGGQVAPASKASKAPFFLRGWSAQLSTNLKIVLLSLAILGAGGYALYVARFGRPSAHPVQAPAAAPATERRGQGTAVSSPPAVAGDTTEASPDKDDPPPLPPRVEGAKLPPRSANGERARSAPLEAPAPVPAGRPRRQDAPPRERAGVPAPERETDANDPGAIIDWLMRKSGQ
jgi:hypothetical protein